MAKVSVSRAVSPAARSGLLTVIGALSVSTTRAPLAIETVLDSVAVNWAPSEPSALIGTPVMLLSWSRPSVTRLAETMASPGALLMSSRLRT